ncbi:hypothetical protein J1614_010630, partial [Plenodomus biglobosus]
EFKVTKRTSASAAFSRRPEKRSRHAKTNNAEPSEEGFHDSDSDFESDFDSEPDEEEEDVDDDDEDDDEEPDSDSDSDSDGEIDDRRDWLLTADYRVFEDEEEEDDGDDDEDLDLDLPRNGIDEENPNLRTVFPPHLLAKLDEQCGDYDSSILCNNREKSRRVQKLDENIRNIIRELKSAAFTHVETQFEPKGPFEDEIFTKAFAKMLTTATEDYLVEQVLSGVPESTKVVLGRKGFQMADILSLPRLSDSELSENSVYLDALEYGPNEEFRWRLYVGSAMSQFGSLTRWNTYLRKATKGTRHERAIKKAGRRMNLRCISHYGFTPEPWLPILAEAVMMIYLGTVNDPRLRQPSHETTTFVNDKIYETFDKIRFNCGLDAPLTLGLNLTWPCAQGWKGPGIKAGAACENCARVVLHPTHPLYSRREWRYADPGRPSASHVICLLCSKYKKRYNKDRPVAFEAKRSAQPSGLRKVQEKSGRKKPKSCEFKSCDRATFAHFKAHKKYYCAAHHSRAVRGQAMDAPIKKQVHGAYVSSHKRPKMCEQAGCDRAVYKYYSAQNKYYCQVHLSRAQGPKGKATTIRAMDAPILSKKTKPQPGDAPRITNTNAGRLTPKGCEEPTCNQEECAVVYHKDHDKFYCNAHKLRAKKGSDMTAPVIGHHGGRTAPKQCEEATCNIEEGVMKYHADHDKFYCNAHKQRALKGSDMTTPVRKSSKRT